MMTTPFAFVCRITPVQQMNPGLLPVWDTGRVLVVANTHWSVSPLTDSQDQLMLRWDTSEGPRFVAPCQVGVELWDQMTDPFEELRAVDERDVPPEIPRYHYLVFPHVWITHITENSLTGFARTSGTRDWPGHWPYATIARARQAVTPALSEANKMRTFLTTIAPPTVHNDDNAGLW